MYYCILGYFIRICRFDVAPYSKFLKNYTYYVSYENDVYLNLIEEKIQNKYENKFYPTYETFKLNEDEDVVDLSKPWYKITKTNKKFETTSKVIKIESYLFLRCFDKNFNDDENEDFYENIKVLKLKLNFKYGFKSFHYKYRSNDNGYYDQNGNYDSTRIKKNLFYAFDGLEHESGLKFKSYYCHWGCPFIENSDDERQIEFDVEKYLEFKNKILTIMEDVDVDKNKHANFSFMMCSNCCT